MVALPLAEEDGIDVGLLFIIAVYGLVLIAPGAFYLRRYLRRERQRRLWWQQLPSHAKRFNELILDDIKALPPASRHVFMERFASLVKDMKPASVWPDALAQAAKDKRLSSTEQAALHQIDAPVRDAAETVGREQKAARGTDETK